MTSVVFEEPGEGEALEEGPVDLPNPTDLSLPKKKKSKKRSQASRGPTALPKNRGSGFEEYFADPPMTAQEAMEEKNDIYSQDFAFEVRMQSCIQRYRSRRRLQGNNILYFETYLFLGGVDSSPSAFTGLDPKELKDLTPAQRREFTARDTIYGGSSAGDRFYNGDEEHWSVDFTGVAAGYFSTALMQLTGLSEQHEGDMLTAVGVVENFLKYVLHHDVCPEYYDDVTQALQVCDKAREEWAMLRRLQSSLPGCFNLAAAELCSMTKADDWAFELFKRPEGFDAKAVFYGALAMLDDNEPFNQVCNGPIHVVAEHDWTFEITEIHSPSDGVIQNFKSLTLDADNGNHLNLQPLGKVLFKPSIIEDEWEHPDMPSHLGGDRSALYFEIDILANLKPGMKMAASVVEISGEIYFVKTICKIVPTFYTFLPQEMMKHFKPPRENERPAPSIHDPGLGDEPVADE